MHERSSKGGKTRRSPWFYLNYLRCHCLPHPKTPQSHGLIHRVGLSSTAPCQLHMLALANDVFQDLPGRWCLLTCVMIGRFQELLDRLLLEWRATRQAGENVFLAWRARKTLCTPRRKDCGYLYDADKDLDVLAIFFVVRDGPDGCGWLSAACLRTKPKVNRLAISTVSFARLQHCLFDDRRMKIESSILSSPEKELTGNSTVGAEQFYGWSLCSRNYEKKGTTVFEGGGGGAGGRVRVCQVNVTRITRKV